MASIQSRNERVYLQIQTALNVIPNTGGTADLVGADASRHITTRLRNQVALLNRRDKTGSRSALPGTAGRRIAEWSLEQSLAGGGVVGTAPDCDPLLRAIFGAAPTAVATGTVAVTGATNATPIVVTALTHGLSDFNVIRVAGVGGNLAANGVWAVNVLTADTFELIGSVGNGAYTSGGTVQRNRVIYALADAILSFVMWRFRTPSTAEQQAGFGCVVNQATFNLGEDIAEWQANGQGLHVIDSKRFATALTEEKGGLSAFPTEPATPVTAGDAARGFFGRFVLNSQTLAGIRTAQMRINPGNNIVQDTFGTLMADATEGAERSVGLTFGLYDDDGAQLTDIKAAEFSKTPLDAVIQIDDAAGNTWVFVLRQVQLGARDLVDDARRFALNFEESLAHGTGLTALDEVTLTVL